MRPQAEPDAAAASDAYEDERERREEEKEERAAVAKAAANKPQLNDEDYLENEPGSGFGWLSWF